VTARTRWTTTAEVAGLRLDKYLAAPGRLGSRRRVSVALERGQVYLNDREAGLKDAGTRLVVGDVVRLWRDRPGSARRRFRPATVANLRILYEDDELLVVNKPAGLLAVPLERKRGADSVYDDLVKYMRPHGKRHPLVVHRIDRDTSGLVLFAKNPRAQTHLKAQFKRREPERVYWALVYGHPAPREGVWQDRLFWDRKALMQKATAPDNPRGTDAVSSYRVLELFQDTSLIEIELDTGKRNQIRIQASLHGHDLVGERRYVSGVARLNPIAFPRQALHARRLAFEHPLDGRSLSLEAPVPPDFAELLARLRRLTS
jgi:23S rRNA pseudouridine1911/1915/1917 synthase